jgi:catechol 2,3-dioxygenase-like lactoylglutathione lyase family enzyme
MRQVGIVVRDIEAAMRHWVEVCGVGPWFYTDRLLVTGFTYAGQHYDDVHISIALANSGDLQLELIQQRCNTPTMYRDFLAAGNEGMQHWSSWPENYDEIYQRALASGYTVGHEGDGPRGRFVYFRNEGHPGTVIEMADATPTRMRIFDAIRCGSRLGWQRSNPPPVAKLRSAGGAEISKPAGRKQVKLASIASAAVP